MAKAGCWVVCLLGALVVVAGAGAVPTTPPPGTPDPSAIVLTAADFPGSSVDAGGTAGTATKDIVASYQRGTAFTAPYGASKYVLLVSTAFVATTATAAGSEYSLLAHQLSSKSGQAGFVKDFLANGNLKRTDARVGITRPHALGIGDASMETGFVFTLVKSKHRTNISLSVIALDRVVVVNVAAGLSSKVVAADAKALATVVVAHASAALVPISVQFPTVSGTALEGQTLTASTGTWGNTPTAYTYQWQDCDPGGSTCTDIAGATAGTYVVEPTDVGDTLRVQVTAKNRFGSTLSTSSVTTAAS